MSVKRQKTRPEQLGLAFPTAGRGEAPSAVGQGTETPTAKRMYESPADTERLMEEVCERENCQQALRRVKTNKGGPGVDGMTVRDLPAFLKQHWATIREQLLKGTYQPQPVKRVEIDKPDGSGVRKLGVPTVLDRFIQQAVLQVLQRRWDSTFSDHSYGFRPGRSAHQAVVKAQQYLAEGYRWVIDLDLEKFFDQVCHDKLMARIAARISDRRVLRLIRAFLVVGVMENGLVSAVGEGMPQGGPLSPLLSNLVLDEWDQELERRGHRFVRGVSLTRMVEDLSPYVRGWRGYFGFCQTPSVLRDLEQWLRRRLRAVQWTHWKHGPRRYAELHKRGVSAVWAAKAASSAHGPWRLAHAKAVKIALPNEFFDSLGLPRLVVPVRLNPPNRRMRTRMSGGVAGVRG